MIEKLNKFIEENLNTDVFVKFNKFSYGKESASCTSFINEEEQVCRIDKSYLDEAFDNMEEVSSFELLNNERISNKREKHSNINNYINSFQNENKFQELLFKYIDSKNIKDSDVYNKVHIDRRLFSKIRSDINYHPSKETVILLGLSLCLNEQEFEELLNSAAYSLPRNNVYDLIIRFCFIEGIYNLKDVNSLLESYNCKSFSY